MTYIPKAYQVLTSGKVISRCILQRANVRSPFLGEANLNEAVGGRTAVQPKPDAESVEEL